MRNNFTKLAGLAVVLTAISASAQSHQAIVSVPFAFVAAGRVCPAGEYRFAMDKTLNFLTLSHEGVQQAALLTAAGGFSNNGRTYARFRRYGQRWFLQQVSFAGMTEVVAHPNLKKGIAIATSSDDKVIVAGSRNQVE